MGTLKGFPNPPAMGLRRRSRLRPTRPTGHPPGSEAKLSEKIHDESSATAALTLSVADKLEEHFGELEQAFFAAGELEPAGAAAVSEVSADLFDDLSAVAVSPVVRASWRQRLVPLYRLSRLWLSMRLRLLLTVLRGALPSALERLSPRRLALPLLVHSNEELPRIYLRRPYLTVAAAVVLVTTLASVWAGVVLAATRLG
jgi:hypothetical protein